MCSSIVNERFFTKTTLGMFLSVIYRGTISICNVTALSIEQERHGLNTECVLAEHFTTAVLIIEAGGFTNQTSIK